MPVRTRTVPTTAAPDVVWRVWSDVLAWPEWTDSVTSAEALPGALPLRVGSSFRLRQPRLPATDWSVTELEEGRSFTWTSAAPGTVSVASHLVEADDTGSWVTATFQVSGPAAGLLMLLFGRLVDRYLRLETEGLVRRAEAAASS